MTSMSARIRITRVATDAQNAEQIEKPMLNLGHAVGRRMQRLVPKRSWRLHDSITQPELEKRGAVVAVRIRVGARRVRGKMVDYHLLVERGTSRMAAQPYMRPALYQTRSADLRSTLTMTNNGGVSS